MSRESIKKLYLVTFPCGKYCNQYIYDCRDMQELINFTTYPNKKIRVVTKYVLEKLGHKINPVNITESLHKYDFPHNSKIDIFGKLIFTCSNLHKKSQTYYAIQIYLCSQNRFLWLYSRNPPTDIIGEEVRLIGTIFHKTHNGNPISLLLLQKEN